MENEKEYKESSKKSDEDILKDAKKCFKDAEEAERDNRDRALEDIRFGRLGQQWPENIKTQREKEGRPCLTINVMPANIRQVVNDARENKPSIKVHPVDSGADVQTAKIYDGLIRHIEASSRADIAYDTAIEHSTSANVGYFRIDLDYIRNDSFDMDLAIERVANPLTVYGDPYNPCPDGSKWNRCFVTELIEEDEFKRRYPKADKSNFDFGNYGKEEDSWFEDKSIRVAEYWIREEIDKNLYLLSNGEVVFDDVFKKNQEVFEQAGIEIIKERPTKSYKVTSYILTAKEVLEKNDWPGMYIPIVPVYGEEVNENGKVHYFSLIHHAKDAQRNKNYWRSCATEQVALASKTPWIGPKGFAKSDPNWDTANTENHSYLEYDGLTPPQRQPFPGVPAGALQEAANATDDIKSILGLYDASLGAKSNETSGVAINARKREGDISTFHFIDNLSRSIRQAGAILLDLIPHVYSDRQMIRILGEDGTPQNVPMGQKVVVSEQGYIPAEQAQQQGIQGVEKVFDLGVGRYDLVVSTGPSYTSRRQEAAMQMTEFTRSFPQSAPIIGDLLAKNLDWPGADEIAERLKKINPVLNPPQQAPDPTVEKAKADVAMKQQEMVQKDREGQIRLQEKQADLAIKQMEIEMKKMDMQIQAEKNQTEIIKTKMSLASQASKQQHEITQNNNNNYNNG